MLQRAAIKKQFFLDTFDFVPPLNVLSFGILSLSLATSLASPLAATDQTARVWFEFNSSSPLSFQNAVSITVTASGTYLVQVQICL